MIEISTWLKRGEEFVLAEDFTGPFPDEDYIEGAIELSVDGCSLMTRAEWDYVDQLWAYLVNGLIDLQAGKPFKTYFPDQPIEVRFTPEKGGERVRIQVAVNKKKVEATAELSVFVSEMARAAKCFFERMRELVPKAAYVRMVGEISRLEKMLALSRKGKPGGFDARFPGGDEGGDAARNLAPDDEIIFGQEEAVVEIARERFGVWTLEISLLLHGLVESVAVRSPGGGVLLLSLLEDRSLKRSVVSRDGGNKLRFDLSQNQAEYMQVVLLRAYRDGMADVNHIHIEGDLAGKSYDLTLFFGASRPPMSAEEAAKLMGD